MQNTAKKRDLIVGLSYLTVLSLCLGLAACGKDSAKLTTDVISCDQTSQVFNLKTGDEKLKLSQLNPGLYDYAGGDFYFQSSDVKSPLKIQTEETAQRNSDSRQMEIQHQYVCREGYSKTKGDDFEHPITGSAPRLLMVGDSENQLDIVDRGFSFFLKDGYPVYSFFENEKSQIKTTGLSFEHKLDGTWDQHYFLHTGVRQYAFIAKKKTKEGTLFVRILYVKSGGSVLTDGDIFMPLPDVSF